MVILTFTAERGYTLIGIDGATLSALSWGNEKDAIAYAERRGLKVINA